LETKINTKVLEKDGKGLLDRECEKMKNYYVESRRKEIFCLRYRAGEMNGLVISCVGRKGTGRIAVMGRREGRRKQLLDVFNPLTPNEL
jgi:hypothetical protein